VRPALGSNTGANEAFAERRRPARRKEATVYGGELSSGVGSADLFLDRRRPDRRPPGPESPGGFASVDAGVGSGSGSAGDASGVGGGLGGGAYTGGDGAGSGFGVGTGGDAGGDEGEAGAGGAWWWPGSCAGAGGVGGAAGREGIGTNSPGFHVCGWRRIVGSFRNRSACPQDRHRRVPIDSSPRGRSESAPPPIEPVLSSFAQTKSDAPQLEQTGATRSPSGRSGDLSGKRLALISIGPGRVRAARNRDVTAVARHVVAPTEFKRIVVAIDGSPTSEEALEIAIDLTRRYEGQLSVVAVAPFQAVYVGPTEPFATVAATASDRPRYQQIVAQGVQRAEKVGVTGVTGVALEGVIPDELLAFLDEHPSDLLVIGSRGLSMAKRILLGSVSTALVTNAPCPVLVVRPTPTKRVP
jgi:nucleotide-binding universal stress UspA family protein